jgi:hypothetical protein
LNEIADLNTENHCSAFSPVVKEEPAKSFIVVKDRCNKNTSNGANSNFKSAKIDLSPLHQVNLIEDGESTDHSKNSPKLSRKFSKEEKRHQNFLSIMKLITSRKADTFHELENFDDEAIVLVRSPKPHSKNSKLSNYRGVSHNGKKWQVMIMGFAKKIYFGGITTEDEASQKYDKYAILMHGLEVSTQSTITFI